MSTFAPNQPHSGLKFVCNKAAVVVLLSALASSTAAVLHLAGGLSGMAFALVLYQCVPFGMLGVLLRTSRNLKRGLPVRRASAATLWLTSILALVFYVPLALMDTSGMSIAHPGPGLVFFLAPLWALGIIAVVWLFVWGLESAWRHYEAKHPPEAPPPPYTGPRCVSCREPIASDVDLCPKCGYTQPK